MGPENDGIYRDIAGYFGTAYRPLRYDYPMTPRAKKFTIAGSIFAAMALGHILEQYVGWDGAFMTIGSIAVAVWAVWLIAVTLDRRR